MFRLDDLKLFVRAAALSSFTYAAQEAGLQPAQVSFAIKRLEQNLGIRLFVRSTRSIRLTHDGMIWLPHAQQMLESMSLGLKKLNPSKSLVSGLLQIAAPSDLGRNFLPPFLQIMLNDHPELSMSIMLSDEVHDIYKEPIDVAFRYGKSEDASFISLPVSPHNRRVLVASPSWISSHGEPHSLEDLSSIQTLTYSLHRRIFNQWTFTQNGVQKTVKLKSNIISNDAEVIRRFAISGLGVTYRSWIDVHEDVQCGRLKVLLPHILGDHVPLNMISPHKEQISLPVRILHELLKEECTKINELYSLIQR